MPPVELQAQDSLSRSTNDTPVPFTPTARASRTKRRDSAPRPLTKRLCTTLINECVETSGAEISEELLTLLSREGSKRQIVGQSELIPCHAAQIVWKDRMIGRRIFLYTDYEAARYGLIKSTSPTQNKRLDRQTSTDPRKRPTRPTRGLRRVPSASNCADGPSRKQVRDPHRPGNQGSQVRAAARVRGGTGQTMEVEWEGAEAKA